MRLTPNSGDKADFTIELETIEGVADSAFLDRLADRVYEIEELSDVLMGLNPNRFGSSQLRDPGRDLARSG